MKKKEYLFKVKSVLVFDFGKNEMRKKGLSPMSIDALKVKYVVSSLLKTSITVCEKKSKVF